MAKQTTYCRIAPTFWTDPDIRRPLNREQKHLLLYYFTSPHTNMAGLFYCPVAYAAAEAEIPAADVEAWLAGPLAPFVTFDPDTDEVLVHRAAKHQIGDVLMPRDNRAKGLQRVLADTHSERLKAKFLDLYPDWSAALGVENEKPAHRRSDAKNEGASEGASEAPKEALAVTEAGTGTEASTGTETEPPAVAASPAESSHTREAGPGAATAAAEAEQSNSEQRAADGGPELDERTERILSDDPAVRGVQLGMLDDLRLYAETVADPVARYSFEAEGRALISKDNPTYWRHPKTGGSIPWQGSDTHPGRRELFGLALLDWQAKSAGGKRHRLQSSLRYVLPEHLDPHPTPAAKPPLESTAGKFRPGTTDAGASAALERERDAAVAEDQLRIQRWRNANPDEAAAIDAEVEASFPEIEGDDVAAVTRRVQVKAEVNRRIVARIDQRRTA